MTGAHVLVVGAGGNIGSHLVPHLGRMAAVARVTLVDGDTYEASNLAGQDIMARDIGRPKVLVQAARLEGVNPALHVVARREVAEGLPLGDLRADVILACLDSRVARLYVNEAAWRLGIPWIDAGVEGPRLLARVNVYRPGSQAPCLECAWDEHDYAALEARYPCGNGSGRTPTNAPSSLGALAAALQAIECQKVLGDAGGSSLAGGQLLVDLAHQKQYVTTFRRNPCCRLADHEPWTIQALAAGPRGLTAAAAFGLAGAGGACGVGVAGTRVSRRRVCERCGCEHGGLRFVRPSRVAPCCRRCGGRLTSPGADVTEELTPEMVCERASSRSLAGFGVRPHDVLVVRTRQGEAYFELSDEAATVGPVFQPGPSSARYPLPGGSHR